MLLARAAGSGLLPPERAAAARTSKARPAAAAAAAARPDAAPSAADAKTARRAARAVPVRVVHVSKSAGASPGLEAAADEWLAKLRRHAPGVRFSCLLSLAKCFLLGAAPPPKAAARTQPSRERLPLAHTHTTLAREERSQRTHTHKITHI